MTIREVREKYADVDSTLSNRRMLGNEDDLKMDILFDCWQAIKAYVGDEMDWNMVKDSVMPFGKHKNKTIVEIADGDVLYLDWLIGQEWLYGDLRGIVQTACDEYADAIRTALEDACRETNANNTH